MGQALYRGMYHAEHLFASRRHLNCLLGFECLVACKRSHSGRDCVRWGVPRPKVNLVHNTGPLVYYSVITCGNIILC